MEHRAEYQIIDQLVTVPDILPLAQIAFARAKEMEGLLMRFQKDVHCQITACVLSIVRGIPSSLEHLGR